MENEDQLINQIDENFHQIEKLIHQKIEIWSNNVVFSWLWWLGVGMSVVPWIIWIIFRKKQSTDRLMYSGFFVMIISLVLDVVGDQFGFWHYRFNVMPVLPTYFPWDLTLMPLTVIFFIQIKTKLNPFIKAVLFALMSAYIAEPFFHWLKIYELDKWRYTYSFPIQILIYLVAHYISTRNKFSPLTD